MAMTRSAVCPSGILDGDRLEDVGDILAAVEGVLEEGKELFELDDLERIRVTGEEVADGTTRGGVAEVFKAMNLDPVLLDALEPLELAHPILQLEDGGADQLDQLGCRRRDGPDPVQHDRVADLLDVVEDVVQSRRQRVDVFAVERCDEVRLRERTSSWVTSSPW